LSANLRDRLISCGDCAIADRQKIDGDPATSFLQHGNHHDKYTSGSCLVNCVDPFPQTNLISTIDRKRLHLPPSGSREFLAKILSFERRDDCPPSKVIHAFKYHGTLTILIR
jgi:hypothetical protein